MRSQMTPLSFGIRSLWDVSSSARTVPPQMWAGFAGVLHAVRACVGGFQFHCASSSTVAAGVSFSAQSVANAASFGFHDFSRLCHECEQAVSYSFSAHNPGVDVNRLLSTDALCGAKVRAIPMQIWQDSVSAHSPVTDSTHAFGRINGLLRILGAYVTKPTHKVSRCE